MLYSYFYVSMFLVPNCAVTTSVHEYRKLFLSERAKLENIKDQKARLGCFWHILG